MNIWRALWRAKVRVLRLGPGDVVVLESTEPLSPTQAAKVRDQWIARFPDTPCTVLGSPLTLGGVVRGEPPPRVPQTPNPTKTLKRGAK